tara:strand:+ start:408 stop:728 length:321 start_codon:yes stop_codon:yes gene_type:complete
MASTPYHNITGSTGVTSELISSSEKIRSVESINIANTRDGTATITVFIQDDPTVGTTSTFKIIENLVIPKGVTFVIDGPIPLSKGSTNFGLHITVGSSDTVDVLIR